STKPPPSDRKEGGDSDSDDQRSHRAFAQAGPSSGSAILRRQPAIRGPRPHRRTRRTRRLSGAPRGRIYAAPGHFAVLPKAAEKPAIRCGRPSISPEEVPVSALAH